MSTPIKEIESQLAYAESLLGEVLVVETSGNAYGVTKSTDGLVSGAVLTRLKVATTQTLSQMGTRVIKVHPQLKLLTG